MQKWKCAIVLAIVFVILSLPQTYNLVDSLLRGVVTPVANNGCPTVVGVMLHAVVFALLVRVLKMDRVRQTLMLE